MAGDELAELEWIKRSLTDPSQEERAKISLLRRVYRQVAGSYSGYALNGGRLSELPPCVREFAEGLRGSPCEDDMGFTYNAIRVLMARYMNRDERGLYLETPSMVMARVAEGFRGYADTRGIYRLLVEGRFLFNSPTLFNMYSNGARGTLSACYVTPVYDDMASIMDAGSVQAMTFKWGGGQGFSFSELRPRWDVVRGTSGYSSGPLSFIQLYDKVTELVKQGGKRRGANMGIMHAWHPDIYTPGFNPYNALYNDLPAQVRELLRALRELIEEVEGHGFVVDRGLKLLARALSEEGPWTKEDAGFIQAKKPPLQDWNLVNFNISVGVNDAFMKAVLEDGDWWMVNPRYSERGGVYRIHYTVSRSLGLGGLGEVLERHPWILESPYLNLYEDVLEEALAAARAGMEAAREAGQPLREDSKNTHAWRARARDIWEEIVETAWAGGDPGLYLTDNHNKWNPTPWLGVVVATNPCAEQPLYPFENCNLGSMSVDKYVAGDGRFDLESFYADVHRIVDAMDSVIDLNNHPDPRHYRVNSMTRKIGLGIMGLANALAKIGYPYDSEEAVAFTLILAAALEAYAWKRSWERAAERGHAPAFECREYDWREFRCRERGDPEELSSIHISALVKASKVLSIEGGWVKVRYHEGVRIPDDMRSRLRGLATERIEGDGSLRLVREAALLKVLERVFGVSRSDVWGYLEMPLMEVVRDPRGLLALAVFRPREAWEALRLYGRLLGARAPRNTVVTTIAPTGTISILAGTSSGIEPYFALAFIRQVAVGTFLEVVRLFRDELLALARRHSVGEEAVKAVFESVRRHKGSLRRALADVREELEEAGAPGGFIEGVEGLAWKYATTMDIDLWYHLAHQIAAQVFFDQAISKTVNLPREAGVDDVYTCYLLAWLGGLKGFTVYRDESKSVQVIVFGGEESGKRRLLARTGEAALRMATPRRRVAAREAGLDRRLADVFRVRGEGEEVVVEIDVNSACTHCDF